MRVPGRGRPLCGLVALLAFLLAAPAAAAQPGGGADDTRGLWGALTAAEAQSKLKGASTRPERYRPYSLQERRLANVLRRGKLVLSLPHPDGGFRRFALEETPVLAPELAAEHPEILTFTGTGLDDPSATVHADLTPLGFHASVRSPEGAWYVDPGHHRGARDVYVSYHARDLANVRDPLFEPEPIEHAGAGEEAAREAAGSPVTLRTYRLALVSDPSYAAYFEPENVTAAKATLVSRVSQIYETESAIRLVLADGNDALNLDTNADATIANGPCGAAACYTPTQLAGCSSSTISRTRIVVGQLLGASGYDVGHLVLGKNGGGIAGLGVVGLGGKARGCTGLPEPVGDFFAVDYVAHELGHQFGANHTFNGVNGNCRGSNRNAATSVEPGSGSTIMAYAGICGGSQSDDLQPHTDAYWSQRSRLEIAAFVGSGRSPIDEVQTVSLRGFGGTDSFRLRFEGKSSALVRRGTNYSKAGIKAALEGIAGFGGKVDVAGFGGGTLADTGFQVTFRGGLGARDVPPLQLVAPSGATGFVGETTRGGAVTNGGALAPAGNAAPTVSAPAAFTIPVRTPFALTASGSDPDGDPLTYLWEQNNVGGTVGTALFNGTKTNGPLFRVFGTALRKPPYVPTQYENTEGVNAPTADPTRVFPDLAQILAGNTNAASACPAADVECFSEFLPTSLYSGRLAFRVTARDGRAGGGGVATADTKLTLAPAAGPFLVTSHEDGAPRTGGEDDTVTWDVAGTDAPPVSAAFVRISISLDGGLTYPCELEPSTENDGAHDVTFPDTAADEARIKVEAVGNVFFDLNDASFELAPGTGPPDTTVCSGPHGSTNEPAATFTFLSRPDAAFECRVDTDPFEPCESPHTTAPLDDGVHTFEVQATEFGDTDPTPAARTFTVDTVPPGVPALSGPSGATGAARPTFTFASEPGATFECRLDAAPFAPCASAHTTARVAAGEHEFQVRARDEAGNVGEAAGLTFVYVLPPETKLGKRTLRHAARTATFRFGGYGGIGPRTFQCRLTGTKATTFQRTWRTCASPRTYRKLKPAAYTFHVRARDATGRVDPTPAKTSFRIRRA